MTTLAAYDRARAALAEATRIDQVLPVLAEIEHVKLYARQIADRELLADATVYQMKAERRLGEVIAAAKEAGHFKQGKRSARKSESELSPRATLEEVGVDRKLSVRAQRAASISERAHAAMLERRRQAVLAGAAIVIDPIAAELKEQQDAKRKADHAARTFTGGKISDLHRLIEDGAKFASILADPPWHFVARSDKGEARSAAQHYTTDREWHDIIALPVAQLAADDAVLFLWMVDWCPKLALEVIEAWGFAHKTTAFTWAKQNESGEGWHMGQGYWTRANPEDCWLATRGSPKRIHADVRQLIVHPVMEHSRKPDEIHDRIERLVGGPYLELYARRERARWITWGNEIEFKPPTLDGEQYSAATGEIAA